MFLNFLLGLKHATQQDYVNIRFICECVSRRAAHLVSAGIATLLNKMNEPVATVGIDGSVYRYHPHFHDLMMEKIGELVNPGIKVCISHSKYLLPSTFNIRCKFIFKILFKRL